MLWQLAYAEFIFTPVCWPDFDEKNYIKQFGFIKIGIVDMEV